MTTSSRNAIPACGGAADDGAPQRKLESRKVLTQLAGLKSLSAPMLRQHWWELFGTEPPAFNRAYFESRLAYRIQELAYGGLTNATRSRLEALGEKLDGGNPKLRRSRADDRPVAGTRLVREYKGVEHVVTVLAGGFEFQGRPYRSLSAIAREIASVRWNGPAFFGLRRGALHESIPEGGTALSHAHTKATMCCLHPEVHG